MGQCFDCDNVRINFFVDEGNGKCDKCHGSGLGDALDQFSANLVNEESKCEKCAGTGQCQNCGGTGTV